MKREIWTKWQGVLMLKSEAIKLGYIEITIDKPVEKEDSKKEDSKKEKKPKKEVSKE